MVDAITDNPKTADYERGLAIELHGDIFMALHFDPFNDAFPPIRNKGLLEAWEKANQKKGGDEAFTKIVKENLSWSKGTMSIGEVVIRDISTHGYRAPLKPDIKINITPKVKERGLWWNDYAKTVFENGGVEGLINDPTFICLALGMGQWLDTGNLMAEPRYVGNSLNYSERPDLDLYKHFGVKLETFAIYPHAKHWTFYKEPFSQMIYDKHLSAKAAYYSLKEIQELMEMNKIKHLVIQSTWFLDPELTNSSSPVYNEGFLWMKDVFKNTVEIGPADEINTVLRDYSIATSSKRKEAYEAGIYKPMVYASVVSSDELSESLLKLRRNL
jgi:hypothetical protein